MDSDKRSAQVERLQVVDTGRRRRWSEEEKLKIVVESFRGPRQVAATARRKIKIRDGLIETGAYGEDESERAAEAPFARRAESVGAP